MTWYAKWWRRVPWAVRVVVHPDEELDMKDKEGRPDHAKIVGLFAFTVFIVLILMGKTPPLGHTIALLSVIFGWIGWRAFLASRTATSHETIETKLWPLEKESERMPDDERA